MTRTGLLQLVRFGIVGLSNTVVTLAIFLGLTRVAGVPAAAASAIGFAAGAANGYRLNRRWTFRSGAAGPATLARYVGVQLVGAGLSAGGVALAASDLQLRHLLAEALILPVVTVITFALSRRLVFGHPAAA